MRYEVPCPNCGGWNTQYVDLRDPHGKVSIMCWGPCGMDFDVNGIWFMFNRVLKEEPQPAEIEEEQ